AIEHSWLVEAHGSLPAGRDEADTLRFHRRRSVRRAGPWPPGPRRPSDPSHLSLRLRQAVDRELPPLLPRRARIPGSGLSIRQRLRTRAKWNRRGGRRPDPLRKQPPPPPPQEFAAPEADRDPPPWW